MSGSDDAVLHGWHALGGMLCDWIFACGIFTCTVLLSVQCFQLKEWIF